MPIVSDQNNPAFFKMQNSGKADSFGYNLQEEKKRIALGVEEIRRELLEKWEKTYANAEIFPSKVAAMHPEVVDFLLSFNLVSVYDDIAKQAGLDAKGRNEIPHIIWEIAETKNWNGLEQILKSKIATAADAHTLVAKLLQENIIEKIKTLSEKPVARKISAEKAQRKEIQLELNEALAQYHNLGEQGITNNPLKLSYFPTPVRPSIKNWITDFHNNMGPGKHSAMDRSNYLFHSENGKKVTPIERQRLSIILKSLEEKTLLKIDPEKQVIIFENNEQPIVNKQQPMISVSQEMGERNMDFKTTNNTEQKDIFQRYVPQAIKKPQPIFSTNFKDEKKVQSSIKDENYFKNVGQKTNSGKDNYFNDFASIKDKDKDKNNSDQKAALVSGSISFSSSQKLPAEQAVDVARTEAAASAKQKPNAQSIPPKQFQQHSQWQMKPKSYKNNETEFIELKEEAKNTGNIIDLRN